MAKNYNLQVRLNNNQKERLRNNASAKGFETVSAYVRDLILNRNLVYERKIDEMYEKIMKIRI
jgi:hypothetical protein